MHVILWYCCTTTSPRLDKLDVAGVEGSGNDLDPVSIRVVDKGNVSHPALLGPLLEPDAKLIESLASGLEVVDSNTDVAETSSRLLVTGSVALEIGIILSTPVVTELKNTLSVKELVPDAFLVEVGVVETVGEGKEVVGEITAGGLVENLHTKNLLVERKRDLRVPNPEHRVVELVSSGVRSGSGHFCELEEIGWTR